MWLLGERYLSLRYRGLGYRGRLVSYMMGLGLGGGPLSLSLGQMGCVWGFLLVYRFIN